MTDPSTLPERLLALGASFTRHHDALLTIATLNGPEPADTVLQHVSETEALTSMALEVSEDMLQLGFRYRSPDFDAGRSRVVQLATMAQLAANHLMDAVEILEDAADPHMQGRSGRGRGKALLAAARRTGFAGQLISLSSEDCLATAGLLARTMRQWQLGPEHRPPKLSPTQYAALEAIAAGRVTLDRQPEKCHVHRGGTVSIATVRSLEARGLVHRTRCALNTYDERAHLTSDGRREIAAAMSHSPSTAPTTVRPAATASRSASRPAATAARAATR